MLQLMYDSVMPTNIPLDAGIVAGYADGIYRWSVGDWRRFPLAKKVAIFTSASNYDYSEVAFDAFVLDIEHGDAVAEQAPSWVENQRRRGRTGRIWTYTSLDNRDAVSQAFKQDKIQPAYQWVAWYNNIGWLNDVPGAIAKQFIGSMGGFDLSVVNWP